MTATKTACEGQRPKGKAAAGDRNPACACVVNVENDGRLILSVCLVGIIKKRNPHKLFKYRPRRLQNLTRIMAEWRGGLFVN